MTRLAVPSPYYMCSVEECWERVECNEVSTFECPDENRASPPSSERRPKAVKKKRTIDPYRAVSKYRRSAAGSSDRFPVRTLPQLEFAVDYLVELLAYQCAPPHRVSDDKNKTESPPEPQRQSFISAVRFVEDRIRAVQVELVKLQSASKSLQLKVVRCHILVLYLMADCSLQAYEPKFGVIALQTALSAYWIGSGRTGGSADREDCDRDEDTGDDEILSYSALFQLNQSLVTQQKAVEKGDNSVSATGVALTIMMLYREHVPKPRPLPRFAWTLKLVVSVELGHWWVVLHELLEPKTKLNEPFLTLARCCLVSSLGYIRWKALQAYNVSFGKGEAVSGQNLGQLLSFAPSKRAYATSTLDDEDDMGDGAVVDHAGAEAALRFGQSAGLPISEKEDSLLFKIQPIQYLSSSEQNETTIIREDGYVLGEHVVGMQQQREGELLIPSPARMLAIVGNNRQ